MPIGPENRPARGRAPVHVRFSIARRTGRDGTACILPSRHTGNPPGWRNTGPVCRSKTFASLPDESAAVLELAPVDSRLLRRDTSKGCSPGDIQVRNVPAEAVGNVVALQPQLELHPFLNGEH